MKRFALVLFLLLVPATGAQAAPTCRAGQGLTIDGRLRIFAVRGHGGWADYACLGRRGRGLHVGDDVSGGEDADTVEGWAFSGRYLAVDNLHEGENDAALDYDVYDLRRRRLIAARQPAFDEGRPRAFGVSARGELITLNGGVVRVAGPRTVRFHGHRVRVGGRRISAAGESATDIGQGAGTLYWTAGGAARSAPLPGAAPDDQLYQPPFLNHPNACMGSPGATVARSPFVRAFRSGGRLLACGVFAQIGALELPADARVKLAGDRWLLAADAASAQVLDMDKGVVAFTVPGASAPLLGADGTLLFTGAAGELAVQQPGMPAPATLSPPGFSAPALGHGVVYWTTGGAPRRFALSSPAPPGRTPGGS
jgi:hypothetical protein